jgi:hypothetical protein
MKFLKSIVCSANLINDPDRIKLVATGKEEITTLNIVISIVQKIRIACE